MIKVCWVPFNYSCNSASTRITIYNISHHIALFASEICNDVCIESELIKEEDYMNFDKLSNTYDILVTNRMDYFPKNKINIRFVDDSINFRREDILHYDMVVSSSKYHSQHYIKSIVGDKSFVIEEALETPILLYKKHVDLMKPKIVWCGNSGNVIYVEDVFNKIRGAGYELNVITSRGYGNVEWHIDTVWENIIKNDVAIVPSLRGIKDGFDFEAKTCGRVAMFMSLGMPVIATPLPAVSDLIINGVNGFISNSIEETLNYINMLHSKSLREYISNNAREASWKKYNINNISNQWINLFKLARIKNG